MVQYATSNVDNTYRPSRAVTNNSIVKKYIIYTFFKSLLQSGINILKKCLKKEFETTKKVQ